MLGKAYFCAYLLLWISCTGFCSHYLSIPQQGSSSSSSSSSDGRQERTLPPRRPSYKPSHSYNFGGLRQQSVEEKSSTEESQCAIAEVYATSIPTGQTKVDHIDPYTISDGTSIEECASKCCKNTQIYQYAWIITAKCFCVGCDPLNEEKCAPISLKTLTDSTYARLNTFTPSKIPNTAPAASESAESATTAALPASKFTTVPPEAPPTTPEPPPTTAEPPPTAPSTLHPPPVPPTVTTEPHPHTTPLNGPHKPENPHQHTRKKIHIFFAGERDLTLPRDHTRISASTSPLPKQNQKFIYKWEKVAGPNKGSLSGISEDQLELTGLVEGVYQLKLTVENWIGEESGEALVNVTVRPPVRNNAIPPTAIISNPHAVITLPMNSVLLDASESHDALGSKQLSFHWEEVQGPVDSTLTSDSNLLQLHNLKEGKYKFRLTVTDAGDLTATEEATVIVKPEVYYPPQASAGKDILVKLPNNQARLDGSNSKSFKGKLQYSWEMLRGPGSVDMKGTNTAVLQLFNIGSTGDYLFQLTVTDAAGHKSSANVSVVVIPENNVPPVADAGPDLTVAFPSTTAHLNGNASTDDFRIDTWMWTQLTGPHDLVLSGADSPLLTVEGLHIDEKIGSPTLYQFQLSVWDYHNLTNTSTVTITYRKDPKIPPHVHAGKDVNITLPQNTVVLNGSGSYDDFGIVSYKWVRSESSPAAGVVVGGSDENAVLILSDLVEGSYNFTLTITNRQSMLASDTVMVHVLPNPLDIYLLQVYLDADASQFTMVDQRQLKRVLHLILDDIRVDYDIVIEEVRPFGPHVRVEFYAVRHDTQTPINATVAYAKLTEKGQDYYYHDSKFHFVKINMKVCQLSCSGRGHCDVRTHRCQCSKFWMENPIKAYFGKKETNCDWSIFYVALVVILVVAFLLFLLWLTCCCCLRRRRIARTKRRVRYAILDRKDVDEGHQMLPRDYQQTSLMVSESETEEELIFESSKDNFGSKIGDVKPSAVQVRTKVPNGKAPGSNGQLTSTSST